MTTRFPDAKVPRFTMDIDGETTEPMTTDILVDLFDFGGIGEDDLDAIVANVPVGGEIDIRCGDCKDEPGVNDVYWTITLRRVE